MIKQITFSAFCDAFRDMGRDENFSYAGKRALFDFLEEVAPDMELDVIALCCEYYENDLDSIISDYCIDVSEAEDDEEKAEIVAEYLNDHTLNIGQLPNGSFVYAQF
jgi:hypothetical protein